MKYNLVKTLSRTTVISSILCLALLIFVIYTLFELKHLEPFIRMKCSDFSSYKEAQQAFKNGQVGLDKNHDGLACNDLKR